MNTGDYPLLVPVGSRDDTDGTDDWLRLLAGHADVRLVLLHVVPDLSDIDPAQTREVLDDAHELLASHARRLGLPESRVERRLAMGDAAAEIVKTAILLRVRMILMSTHNHSGLERLVEGGTTETVMRRAHVPTFICHAGRPPRHERLRRILVPLDGSAQSAEILDTVAELATLTGACVVLYHDDQGYLELETPDTALDVDGQLNGCRAQLEERGIPVEVSTSQLGSPADEILHKVDELDIDLVAMTTHGRRGLARVLFGSVAEQVLHRGHCPLLTRSVAPTHRLQYEETYLG